MQLTDIKEQASTTSEGLAAASTDNASPQDIEFEHANIWRCCSGNTIDKRGVIFTVQVTFVFICLCFCMHQIMYADDSDKTVWISLISAIIGNFMPSGMQSSDLFSKK